MVATSSPLAVDAALWALREGGNAVDAAIAADAVLGVVQPQSTGVGGDGFALVDDGSGPVVGFNGSGSAPAALTAAECRAEGAWHDASALVVTVPGLADLWQQLSDRYGRLGLRRVLQPAIGLARNGFPIGPISARDWAAHHDRLRPGGPFGARPQAGARIANPMLGESLDAIADGGAVAHYGGAWGAAAAATVQREGGRLTVDDLAHHCGEWVVPISGAYRDHEVLQLPPNGQGAAVIDALRRLGAQPAGDPDDPTTVVATARAIREGMEAAYTHVADPRTATVPPFWTSVGRDTVYTAVVAGGMKVGLISSVFTGFGSGIHVGGCVLHNRGTGFSLDPEHPNAVAPGKRPFHTIIPGMVRRDGEVRIVYGVVGGPMQPQGHVQVVRHLVDHELDVQHALDRPRTFWPGGDYLAVERGFADDEAVRAAARADGWDVLELDSRWLGVGQVVRVHPDGWLEGGSDPRHDGIAFGH